MSNYYKLFLYLDGELVLETDTDEQGGTFKLGEVVSLLGTKVEVIESNRSIVDQTIKYKLKRV